MVSSVAYDKKGNNIKQFDIYTKFGFSLPINSPQTKPSFGNKIASMILLLATRVMVDFMLYTS